MLKKKKKMADMAEVPYPGIMGGDSDFIALELWQIQIQFKKSLLCQKFSPAELKLIGEIVRQWKEAKEDNVRERGRTKFFTS